MDTNMEDVGRVPADLPAAPPLEPTTIPTLDGWIEGLMSCKQLAETDVQRLCEKVSSPSARSLSGDGGPAPRPIQNTIEHCGRRCLLACQLSEDPMLTWNHRRGKFSRTSPTSNQSYVLGSPALCCQSAHACAIEMPSHRVR